MIITSQQYKVLCDDPSFTYYDAYTIYTCYQ